MTWKQRQPGWYSVQGSQNTYDVINASHEGRWAPAWTLQVNGEQAGTYPTLAEVTQHADRLESETLVP